MPDKDWFKKYAPWLAEYDGVEALDGIQAHTANRMLQMLQVRRNELRREDPTHPLAVATMDQICDAVAAHIIHGDDGAFAIGMDGGELHQVAQEAEHYVRTELNTKFRDLQQKMTESTADKVARFRVFARAALAERYPELGPDGIDGKLAVLYAEYDRKFGKPLFTPKGEMRNLHTGKGNLSEDDQQDYDEIARVFNFGADSEFSRKLRFERHVKRELAKKYPTLQPEQIEQKMANREYGESVQRTFEAAERERDEFRKKARAYITQSASIPPSDRLRSYEAVMHQYDAEHEPEKTLHPLHDDQLLYEAVKSALDGRVGEKGSSGSAVERLTKENTGRDEHGGRKFTPKRKGPNEL